MRILFILALSLIFFSDASISKETPMDKKATKVKLETSLGDVVIEIDTEKAPGTTSNFMGYVKDGFYNGTVFHRVIKGFMAQGGGYNTSYDKKDTKKPIKNEAHNGLKNLRGTVAMARTPDPHSATAQFFINYSDNAFLDFKSETTRGWGYAVFAKVVDGMDVVDQMATIPTGAEGPFPSDLPKTQIVIKSATIVE